MNQSWYNTVFPIAALFAFRMLGLFMLIPVFTVCAYHLSGANPLLVGLALGSYGLSQGLLQIPFGMLSDRFGRKPILTLGLILFGIGSLIGALTTSIQGMIFARIIQGMGAIGSVLIALLADLTPDAQRTRAMAVIGATIGLSFSLAMVISPAIINGFGLAGIFYLTAALAFMGLLLLHLVIPTPKKEPFHLDSEASPKLFKTVLSNRDLQRLNIGIFFQHLILTSTFFSIPILLQQEIQQGRLTQQWHFYLPLMVMSFLAMIPFITIAEKRQKIKPIFVGSVIITCLSQLGLYLAYHNWWAICGFIFVYFMGFNILEASLPSMISRQASAESKGTAMGIYSSSQFLGIFTGGAIAGWVYQYLGSQGIFIVNSAIALGWSTIALYIRPNAYQLTLILPFNNLTQDVAYLKQKLSRLSGVKEVVIAIEENTIYLRIDKSAYEEGSAEEIIRQRP